MSGTVSDESSPSSQKKTKGVMNQIVNQLYSLCAPFKKRSTQDKVLAGVSITKPPPIARSGTWRTVQNVDEAGPSGFSLPSTEADSPDSMLD